MELPLLLSQHRMIGINYVLRALKNAGLIGEDVRYARDAVNTLLRKPKSNADVVKLRHHQSLARLHLVMARRKVNK